MPLISVTRLRVRAFRYPPSFIFYNLSSSRRAKRAPGHPGSGLLREANKTLLDEPR